MKHYKFGNQVKENIAIQNETIKFEAPLTIFENFIEIKNSIIESFQVYSVYFLAGATFENCTFKNKIIWQSGGHNKSAIEFKNCVFENFVDFENTWFMAKVIFKEVEFIKGCNLLGNLKTPMEVTFEEGLEIDNVKGILDVDTYNK